ncbi:redox-sensitive transcriptional activator SoxR [Pelagovum pacificum]|uniref:Redox-sensitive transcriptional activator SoxR n=1 Tax=Pelagovum pacificum TaxID=2588711 RepID=A0A5C5GC02_9RHOB|nr:redox-sensitive transcriptional activator SoxR [Pelagovum pacificum]QQA44550.1 redox-sensitive transcriptional activator SoxR [Pelagovum pacificum]TNY32335.1 redox-sensitive transcriptional activator SoxR [Pelagovum pacificum]
MATTAARPNQGLTIGDLAERTGLAVSAIRFYETYGIVKPVRNAGGHRRYGRADIRRLSFALVAQRLGFSLTEIAGHLAPFPDHKALTSADWAGISEGFRARIDARIGELERLRDKLDGCIGCGCLSLERCALLNPDDRAAEKGAGPRYVIDAD